MLNIFKRNPAELCSILLLLAGLGQASPVNLEVKSSLLIPLHDLSTNFGALTSPQSRQTKRNLTLSDTIVYDLDNPTISYPTVTSTHGISLNSNIYIVDGDNTPNKTM